MCSLRETRGGWFPAQWRFRLGAAAAFTRGEADREGLPIRHPLKTWGICFGKDSQIDLLRAERRICPVGPSGMIPPGKSLLGKNPQVFTDQFEGRSSEGV